MRLLHRDVEFDLCDVRGQVIANTNLITLLFTLYRFFDKKLLKARPNFL